MNAALAGFRDRLKAYRDDPVGFCREVLDFDPHEGQQEWLRSSTAPENALTTGNRWGKSWIAGAKRVWKCIYRIGWDAKMRAEMERKREAYRSINLSLTAEQARLVWAKALGMLQSRKAKWLVEDVKMTPFPTIIFRNGARFEAKSTTRNGEHLLGDSFDDVNWDEAAYEKRFELVRDNVLRMRVVDRGGTIDYTSTGNGRNEYGRYFLTGLPGEKRDPHLYSQTGSTFQNPHIDLERVRVQFSRMSERMRRQNIQGEIVDAGGGFFAIEDLEAAISDALTDALVTHLFDGEEQVAHAEVYAEKDGVLRAVPWHNRYPSRRYVHFWDLANATDWAVGWTLDCAGEVMQAVEFERFRRQGWAHLYERMRDRHRRYQVGDPSTGTQHQSKTYFDATGVGQTVGEELKDIRAEGFVFTTKSKDEILTDLQSALSLRQLQMPMIPVAYDELKFYEREDARLVQDCVMALCGAVHFGKRKKYYAAVAI